MEQDKKQSDHTSSYKAQIFHKIIVVVKEEQFGDINLTVGATFLSALKKKYKKGPIRKYFSVRHKANNNNKTGRKWLEHVDCPDIV